MKNILFILLATTLSIGCSKTTDAEIFEREGWVKDGGPVEVDGLGYYINFAEGDTTKTVSPENLPGRYTLRGIEKQVKIKFYYTGKDFVPFCAECKIPIIHLLEIEDK